VFFSGAVAAAASRVVLLRGPRDDGLMRQADTLLAAELRAAGFEVLLADRNPERDVRAEFETVSARLSPVVAALAILPAGASTELGSAERSRSRGGLGTLSGSPSEGDGAVELWLADRVTGKLVIRRIETPGGRREGSAADIAVRAVELLRGSLLEVTVERPRPPRGQKAVEAPADVTRWVVESAPDRPAYFAQGLGVAVGATLLAGTGSGATFAPLLGLSWGSGRGLAVRLALMGPGSQYDVSRAEGSAHIRQSLLLLEGLYVFRPRAVLQPFVALSAGGHLLKVDGTGSSSLFTDREGSMTALAGAAGGGAALRLGKHLSLVLDGRLVLLEPPTAVTIAEQEVARVGGASLLATLGLVGSFF
jgi:hypothetical protein